MIFVGYDQKSKGYKLYNSNEGKMVISRDVEFNEEGAWDWKINDGEKYDFLLILDEKEERYEDHQEHIVTPPKTPMSSTSSSSSNESSSSGTPPSPPKKMRSFDDLYEVTNPIDDVTLYYHLAICDTIVFEETIKGAKWRITMDGELHELRRMTHGDWFLDQMKRSQYVSSRSTKERRMSKERLRDTRHD